MTDLRLHTPRYITELIMDYREGTMTAPKREELDLWLSVSEDRRKFLDQPAGREELFRQLLAWDRIEGDAAWERFKKRDPSLVARLKPSQESIHEIDKKPGVFRIGIVRRIAAVFVLFAIGGAVIAGTIRIFYIFSEKKANPAIVATAQHAAPAPLNPGPSPGGPGHLNIRTLEAEVQHRSLSDSGELWLDATSFLQIPDNFGDTAREVEVELEGEAFFETGRLKDPNLTVKLKNTGIRIRVTAAGTAFNVSAYPEDSVRITLVKGAVTLEICQAGGKDTLRQELAPGHQYVCNGSTGRDRILSGQTFHSTFAWKDAKFYFYQQTLKEMLSQMGHWYNMKFEMKGEMPTDPNTISAWRSEPIDSVMKILLTYYPKLTYTIDHKVVTLSQNPGSR